MPSPRAGESREDFLDRCIPEVVAEGRDADQAVAMCIAYYEGEKDKAFNLDKMGEVEYWKAVDRTRESYQSKYEREVAKAFREQLSIYENPSTPADLRKDIDSKPIEDVFVKIYREVGDRFARNTFAGLKNMPYSEMKQPAWMDVLENQYALRLAFTQIRGINDTTKKIIALIIMQGFEEGKSIQEISEEIQLMGGQLFTRAERIARTTIIGASNAGSLEGAKSTGLNIKKQWLATPDSRTRGTNPEDKWNHRQFLDNPLIVDVNEPFVVQGIVKGQPQIDRIQFPGDPTGSPGNIINCRCTQIYITED